MIATKTAKKTPRRKATSKKKAAAPKVKKPKAEKKGSALDAAAKVLRESKAR